MNWDWEKLQEKRQRHSGWRGGSGGSGDGDDGGSGGPGGSGGSGGPGGPGGWDDPSGPDFEKLGETFRKFREYPFPAGKVVVLVFVLLWAASGIYIVEPDELGVVLRFGKNDRTVESGPHYHLPFPLETVYTPKVTQVQRAEVGFRSVAQGASFQQGGGRIVPEEAAMLTGDENIVNVQFSIQFQIKDPVQYLFNVTNPTAVVRSAGEAAMREVIGNSRIDAALTDGKQLIQNETLTLLQDILDIYQVGVRVLAVQMQDVHPPKEVIDAFKDVASAREDKSRIINEAEAYQNEILPRTRGLAAEVINQAEAYRQARVREAEGQANRFLAVLKEYNKAKDVTRKRLYLEAMEEVLSAPGMEKIIIPGEAGARMLPYLPLDGARPRGDAGAARKGGE